MLGSDILIIILGLAGCIGLWALAGYSEKVPNNKWRLAALLPLTGMLLLAFTGGLDICMSGAYIGSSAFVYFFISDKKKARRAALIAGAACMLISIPLCSFGKLYRRVNYTDDFKAGFESMKSHYVLADHKQVDWDMLYDKYLPLFEDATRRQDKLDACIAYSQFCAEFNDNHVYFMPDEETYKAAMKRAGGNDFGFVTMTLSDGKTVAVKVDPSLEALGIHDLTEIVSINSLAPAEAEKSSKLYEIQTYGDIDNAKFYEGLCAAGVNGDSIEVRFIDDNGSEKTVTLNKLSDDYYSRFEDVCEKLTDGANIGHLAWQRVSDDTALLRIKIMKYDSASAANDDHSGLKEEIRQAVLEQKEDGVKNVILDLRANGGGSGNMAEMIASVFAPEGEHYYVTNALWDENKGGYVKDSAGNILPDDDITFMGENILGDGKVILLVNSQSASAGDHLTKIMQGLENTTVIGFTEPAGVAQGIYGMQLESGTLCYSASAMLDRNGSIFIDAGTDGQAGDDVDIKIPFDEKAAEAVFVKGEDYVLNYALEMLK